MTNITHLFGLITIVVVGIRKNAAGASSNSMTLASSRMLRRHMLAVTQVESLEDNVETSFSDVPAYDPTDEDGTVQVYQFTDGPIPGGTTVRCALDCTNSGSGWEDMRFYQGAPPSTWDDYDGAISFGTCSFYGDEVMDETTSLYVAVTTSDSAGLTSPKIHCRMLPATLSSDGTLSDNVEMAFSDLPAYDPMDEDGTVQVYQFTNGTIPRGTTVRCALDCFNSGSGWEDMRFHQGALPNTWDDRDGAISFGTCSFYGDEVMDKTTSLYVAVTTSDSAGLTSPKIHCRMLPATLSSDGTLSDNVEMAFSDLPAYDPMDEDGTVQVYQFTNGTIPRGTTVRCALDCFNSGSGWEDMRFHQGALPNTWDDRDGAISFGTCSFYGDEVMDKTTSLYVAVTTSDSAGLTSPKIHCRMLPATLSSDGTLSDNVEMAFSDLPAYDPMDEDGTVQVYQFTNGTIPRGTTVRCALDCTNSGSGWEDMRFHQGALPNTWDDRDGAISFGTCSFYGDEVMDKTTSLYVAVTTSDSAGLTSPRIHCCTTTGDSCAVF